MSCNNENNTCSKELADLPLLFGCPSDYEWFIVGNAEGGFGKYKYARRAFAQIKNCIIGVVRPPYIGVVDRGNPTDPVSGTTVFQDDSLIGLGATNNGDIQIVIDDVLMSTFGQNAGIAFDPATGTVTNLTGNWQAGSGLFIDRNQ